VKIEAGGRFGRSDLSDSASAVLGNPDRTRSFSAFSASFGGSCEVMPGWRVGLSGARKMRAPSADEPFAGGPHGGSASFEVDNPTCRRRRASGWKRLPATVATAST
jgi:iron complex outermembrane receptor protein